MTIGPWIATLPGGGRLMLALLGAAGAVTGPSSYHHLVYTAGLLALGGALLHIRRVSRQAVAVRQGERALRKELLAYLLFHGAPRSLSPAELGRQLSRMVAVRSSFPRAALMLRDSLGSMTVVGSAGFDDLGVEALNRWAAAVDREERSTADLLATHERVGAASFTLQLDRRSPGEWNPLSTMLCSKVHLVPLRTAEALLGLLVVSADPRASAKRSDLADLTGSSAVTRTVLPVSDLLEPLEALALRLTLQLSLPDQVPPASPLRHPPRWERPTRSSTRSGGHPPKPPEAATRRALDTVASPLDSLGTAGALEQLRQIIDPAAAPAQRVAGVSGRPPRSIWRS